MLLTLKTFIIIFFFFFLFYRMGLIINYYLKDNKNEFYENILDGFVFTMCIFEIMALPFSFLNLNVKVLYIIAIIVFFLLMLYSLLKFRNTFKLNILCDKFKAISSVQKYILIFTIILVLTQVIMSFYLIDYSPDDSIYVSWSEEVKDLKQYMEVNPSYGLENSIFPTQNILNSWEIFNGFVARIFNIEVTTLVHTIYPCIFIIISYFSYFCLLKKLNKKNSLLMLLILAFIFCFVSGLSGKFIGSMLLTRIWHGKALLICILVPYLIKHLLDLEFNKKELIFLIMMNTAVLSFDPIALWFVPILEFLFTIIILFYKGFKQAFKMIFVIIPELILLPLYLKIAILGPNKSLTVEGYDSYSNALMDYIKNGWFFVIIYLLCIIYIIYNKKKRNGKIFKDKLGSNNDIILLICIPILTFITFLNPLICNYVQQYVTSNEVYWRLYWLIPFEITISYALSEIIMSLKNSKLKIMLTILFVLVIIVFGKNIYGTIEYRRHENYEKISQYVIDEVNFILHSSNYNDVIVLAPGEPYGFMIRQLTDKIQLAYSRGQYTRHMGDENIDLYWAYDTMYNNFTKENVYDFFDKYNRIDYVILNKNDIKNIDYIIKDGKVVYEDTHSMIIKNINTK